MPSFENSLWNLIEMFQYWNSVLRIRRPQVKCVETRLRVPHVPDSLDWVLFALAGNSRVGDVPSIVMVYLDE